MEREPILETKDLTVAFSGHIAINGVNFNVSSNHFKSIIGPNGAGKTTLFNLLSGQIKPTKGKVLFRGRDVTSLSPPLRTRLGMGRSFQITNVFPNLSVLENVRLAVQSQAGIGFQFLSDSSKLHDLADKSKQYLTTVLLEDKLYQTAKDLSHGDKRKLEIAMLLALEPKLMLLDEPTAGISLEEVPAILEVIRKIKNERNRTIILIEHKIDMVLDLSDSITVLYNGKLLADGTPQEIMNNELVQSSYLGGLEDDAS